MSAGVRAPATDEELATRQSALHEEATDLLAELHRARVVAALQATGRDDDAALAQLMIRAAPPS